MDSAEAIVMKSGENCIQVSLSRNTDGLLVKVWAQPKVEDFVRSLGTGEKLDVATIGRHWLPSGKDKSAPLLVYALTQAVGPMNVDEAGFSFSIDRPGYPLVEAASSGDGEMPSSASAFVARYGSRPKRPQTNEMLNMGFLRLVGISGESGVSFVVHGVYTREGINMLAARIEEASRKFYKEFLKPYRVIVTVSTMPIPESF
jgi:hypothetical protein